MGSLIAATILVSATTAQSPCGGIGDDNDWLITGCSLPATITPSSLPDGSTQFLMENGIVRRTLVANKSSGLLATTSIAIVSGDGAGEKLVGAAPGALVVINDVAVVVGGPGPMSSNDTRPRTRFVDADFSHPPVAGSFHWVPGTRGTNPAISWPPAGIRGEFQHQMNCSVVGAHSGVINITEIIEMYPETSAFGRRLTMSHSCESPLYMYNMSFSVLYTVHDRAITTHTDAAVSSGRIIKEPYGQMSYHTTGFLSTPGLSFFGPGTSDWEAKEPFETFFVAEVVYDVSFGTTQGTLGMTRYGLTAARMMRVLAPQTEQTPIKVTGLCTGSKNQIPIDGTAGSVGLWCYDTDGTTSMNSLVEQAAEVGVEMLIFTVNMNETWRSTVGNEFQSTANISWFRAVVAKANSLGIEVGAYQLLLNARSATALNQAAPHDAATLPNAGYDTMDPSTRLTCHNKGNTKCTGGSGCCAMCGATEFYDAMEESMYAWWKGTGVTAAGQDGAESMTPCANESHTHHHGLNDSIWEQYKAVRRTFNTYCKLPSEYGDDSVWGSPVQATSNWTAPKVGFIAGMPGSVMEAGEAKVPGGYSETTFSLPRWTWIDRIRERIITINSERSIGTRMFPLILTAPYHPSEPDPMDNSKWREVVGYNSVATMSPMEEHTTETEWAFSTHFGTGVHAEIQAISLWNGPKSKAIVQKWVSWAKRYRRILSAEFLTVASNTTCWGSGNPNPNSTCVSVGLDAIVHRAPKHYYSDISERALAMVWNPTNQAINTTLTTPLYYAGLSTSQNMSKVIVSKEGQAGIEFNLGVNDTIPLPVSLGPRELTWFVVTEEQKLKF